jgi:hypothetical protein
MQTWINACSGDLRRFKAIHQFLKPYPKLVEFLFRTDKAELHGSPEGLLKRSAAFSTGEKVLIRVALDIWSESGDARINDLDHLDPHCFKNVTLGLLIAHGFQPNE